MTSDPGKIDEIRSDYPLVASQDVFAFPFNLALSDRCLSSFLAGLEQA